MIFGEDRGVARAALDSLEEIALVFDESGRVKLANRAAQAARHSFLPDDLYSVVWNRLKLKSGVPRRSDVPFVFHSSRGKRVQLYFSAREMKVGRQKFTMCLVRRSPSAPALIRQRDRSRAELEASRVAALNYMEDMVLQKEELEAANRSLAEAIDKNAASEEARLQLASIVESSEDPILSCSLQGTINSWNGAAERLFGYAATEVIGSAADAIFRGNDEHLEGIRRRLAAGESVSSFVTAIVSRCGERIEVSTTWSPLRDRRGRMAGYSIIARDIRSRLETERELERHRQHLQRLVEERTSQLIETQERARQAERLASIGALAAGIAHEINNPIGAMLLAAQNSLESIPSLETAESSRAELLRLAQKVLSHARRCGFIVRGVLQFARKGRAERSWLNLNTVVESSLALIRESITLQSCSIDSSLDRDNPPRIWANALELEQIIVNVVKNACESGNQGLVQVSVQTYQESGRAVIVVSDTGRGMSEEERRHIFDPFYTTRQNRGGTGLGLSIVHGIVSSYGGSIAAQSSPGQGTRMRIEIPLEAVSDNAPSTAA